MYRILLEGKRMAGTPPDLDPLAFGIEANRASLPLIAEYAFHQKLIPNRVSVDDMFAETHGILAN